MDTWESNYINDCDPCLLTAKSTTPQYNNDNPSYKMAIHGPFQAEYHEPMQIKSKTLAEIMKCWDWVPCTPKTKVIQLTWALNVKGYPDGILKKFKARFCAHGNQQLEGVIFKTCFPVV